MSKLTTQKFGEKLKASKPKDVASYIINQAPEAHPILKELRKIIKSAVPKVEETISWNAPFYKYHGMLAGFAAYKRHVRFGIVGYVITSEDRKMLEQKGYTTLERGMQIKFDQKVPAAAIKQMLKAKAKINEKREH